MNTRLLLALVFCSLLVPAITSNAAKADADEQGRKACMTDALTVCAQYIPDRQRIALCLMTNRNRISRPCRILISGAAAAH